MESSAAANVRDAAANAFASGLYCAESVLVAVASAQGMQSELLPRIATVFCSGMARTCGTCGALTGGMMGISLMLGRTNPGESIEPAYAATQRLISEFEKEFGARDCHELLGCDLGKEEGRAIFRDKQLGKQCAAYTAKAAELAAQILAETRPVAPRTESTD